MRLLAQIPVVLMFGLLDAAEWTSHHSCSEHLAVTALLVAAWSVLGVCVHLELAS